MRMIIFHYSFVLSTLSFIVVVSDEQAAIKGHPALSEDYLTIFKNMPLLYEYILATLTKNPEVLEFSQSYYTDANIYDYRRNNDEVVKSNDEQTDTDSEKNNRKRNINNDNFKQNGANQQINFRTNPEYDVAANTEDSEQDNENTVVQKRDNQDNDKNESTIDPSEVKEKAIWAEEQLEKHNNSR